MLDLAGTGKLHKIVVLNPKGGSGKTTLAFSLAAYLAASGRRVGLLDMDVQGSSGRWLQNRPDDLPAIAALAPPGASGKPGVPADLDCVVIDAPAGLAGADLIDYTCGAHAILVPVLPSDLDIHAASRLVKDLLLVAQVSRRNGRLGIVANRVRERTIAYRQLMRFLESLSIALVGVLRDSQNYTRAAALGKGIHELAPSQVSKDLQQWQALTQWLESRLATPLNARDHLRPARPTAARKRRRHPVLVPAAAAAGAIAVAAWFLFATRPAAVDASLPLPAVAAVPVASSAPEVSEAPKAVTDTSLQDRWQLTGVVHASGDRRIILAERDSARTVNLARGQAIDGWAVTDIGPDFAVFARDGEKLRLLLVERVAQR